MPCVCGQKVERSHQKIQCAKCKFVFHIACVNILPADAEFLHSSEKPFYCKVCAADRRGSIRTPPPIIVLDDSVVTVPTTESDASNFENCSMRIDNANACQMEKLQKKSVPCHQSEDDAAKIINLNDGKQQITLQLLFPEIVTLREQNSCIISKVNELQDDKNHLNRKIESLQSELRSMQSKLCIEKLVSSINALTTKINIMRSDISNAACIYPAQTSLDSNCTSLFSTETIGSPSLVSVISAGGNNYAVAAPAAATTTAAIISNNINDVSVKVPYANARAVNNNNNISSISFPSSISPASIVSAATTEISDSLTYSAAASYDTRAPTGINIRLSSATTAPIMSSNLKQMPTAATSSLKPMTTTDTASVRSLAQPQWEIVQSKKGKNKNTGRSVVIGQNSSKDLDVFASRRWLHLSSFKPNVTEENILSFVSKNAGIDKDNLSCFKLIKKGTDTSSLKKVNFKLGVNTSFYDKVLSPSLWPANVEIRPFKFFQREEQSKNPT